MRVLGTILASSPNVVLLCKGYVLQVCGEVMHGSFLNKCTFYCLDLITQAAISETINFKVEVGMTGHL